MVWREDRTRRTEHRTCRLPTDIPSSFSRALESSLGFPSKVKVFFLGNSHFNLLMSSFFSPPSPNTEHLQVVFFFFLTIHFDPKFHSSEQEEWMEFDCGSFERIQVTMRLALQMSLRDEKSIASVLVYGSFLFSTHPMYAWHKRVSD